MSRILVRKQRHLLHSLENVSLQLGQLHRTSVCGCAFTLPEAWLMYAIFYVCFTLKYLYLI